MNHNGRVIIGIKNHKMATQQVATLCLTMVSIFMSYFPTDRYSVDPSTSQEARRAAEADAVERFTPRQTDIVARYLTHTTKVAESHYRMQTPDQINETAELLSILNK